MIKIIVGAAVIFIGYLIAYRQKIELLHFYHVKNVKEEDKAIMCKYEGIGNMITGAGVITGSTLILLAGIAVSLYSIWKYNGGLF